MREWARRLSQPVAPHPTAAFRILFGTYLFWYFARFAGDVELLFSASGVYVPFPLVDIALPTPAAYLTYALLLATIVAFVVGYRTRVVTPLLLGLFLYFWMLNLAVRDSTYDRLNLLLLFVCCFSDLDGVWSLGPSRTAERKFVSGWGQRLLVAQMCLLYFGSGLWKLTSPSWHSGEMMRMTLASPWATELAFAVLALDPPEWTFTALTWSVTILELTLPVLLLWAPLRPIGFAAGIGFHLANWVLLAIPEFLNCATTYVLFARAESVARFGNACFRAVGETLLRWSGSGPEIGRGG